MVGILSRVKSGANTVVVVVDVVVVEVAVVVHVPSVVGVVRIRGTGPQTH